MRPLVRQSEHPLRQHLLQEIKDKQWLIKDLYNAMTKEQNTHNDNFLKKQIKKQKRQRM